MTHLKSAIRKAITENTKYTAIMVYKPEMYGESFDGTDTMRIEIDVRKKKKSLKK